MNNELYILSDGIPSEKIFLEKIDYLEYENILLAHAKKVFEIEERKKLSENK